MISFKSEHMGNAYIQQHLFFGLYGDRKTAIVKFDPKSEYDNNALKTVKNDWKSIFHDKVTFADDIYDDFVGVSHNNFDKEHIFLGLTLQEDTFEHTNPSQILGLAEVARVEKERFAPSEVYILDYIETKPDCMRTVNNREYKNVGQRLLDFIIYKFKELPLVLQPTKQAVNFYLNNGFQWLSKGSDILILRR